MTIVPWGAVPPRLQRAELAVPGSSPRFLEKAARADADLILLDCEDSVAPADKATARANIIATLNELDWGERVVSVRINGLDTPYMYRDLIDIAERCPRLDMILVPKVNMAADLHTVATLLDQIEQNVRRERPIGLEALIETPLGLGNVEAIAGASRRLEAMSFGAGDFAAATGMRTTTIGGGHPDYGVLAEKGEQRGFFLNDMWHYAQARLCVACRAHGLRPIDGAYGDYSDPEGYLAAARRAAVLGFEGKWAIHPSQIELTNRVFTPTAAEVGQARRIIEALAEAERDGRAAVTLDGRMIDIASIRMAEQLLHKAERLGIA